MHRQSLGSPVSKHHGHGGAKEDTLMAEEEPKHKDDDSASEEERKATRRRRSLSPPPKPEKFVHVIPVVTLLCFLILYLCSHSPSQSGTSSESEAPCFPSPPTSVYLILTVRFWFICFRFGSVQWI